MFILCPVRHIKWHTPCFAFPSLRRLAMTRIGARPSVGPLMGAVSSRVAGGGVRSFHRPRRFQPSRAMRHAHTIECYSAKVAKWRFKNETGCIHKYANRTARRRMRLEIGVRKHPPGDASRRAMPAAAFCRRGRGGVGAAGAATMLTDPAGTPNRQAVKPALFRSAAATAPPPPADGSAHRT